MKLVVAVFVATALAYVYAESCLDTKGCTGMLHTRCSGHTHIVCQENICHCSHGPTGTCTAQSDCTSGCTHHGHGYEQHCVDGYCHCTQRPHVQGGHPPQ